jgi:hypothetical protein
MNDDIQHLRYLAIGHYIGAAIIAVLACLPLIQFSVGLIFLFNLPAPPDGDLFPMQLFGLMFALIGGMVLLGWAFAALIFLAGRSLATRKRYMFCFVMAALCCALFPLGTTLGGLHDPGLDEAHGQGAVPGTSDSRHFARERSATWGMA